MADFAGRAPIFGTPHALRFRPEPAIHQRDAPRGEELYGERISVRGRRLGLTDWFMPLAEWRAGVAPAVVLEALVQRPPVGASAIRPAWWYSWISPPSRSRR